MPYCLSLAFCSVFVFLILLNPRLFVQLFFDMHAPRQPHAVTLQLSVFFVCLVSFCVFGDVAFSEYYVPLRFPFCIDSALYVFLPDGAVLPCDHGLDLNQRM